MGLGTPVIALRRGGAAETVLGLEADRPTGVFFDEQTPQAIVDAVERFERASGRIEAGACIARAAGYSPAVFDRRFGAWVDAHWTAWQQRLHGAGKGGAARQAAGRAAADGNPDASPDASPDGRATEVA
jgi:hypothetical protein